MAIKKHPEWKDKYCAVDGIEKKDGFSSRCIGDKKAVRSDIEKILNLNDEEFTKWFSDRKIAAQRLLKDYEIISDIPFLAYGCEGLKNNLGVNNYIRGPIDILKKGIEYLDILKQVRDEKKEY
jgi:hypothetical protein